MNRVGTRPRFPPAVDFYDTGLRGKVQAASRVIWYRQAARLLAGVLDDFRPDVVHLLNIYHQLSPSLLPEITQRGIPIVQTLNDYKLICPTIYSTQTMLPVRAVCRGHTTMLSAIVVCMAPWFGVHWRQWR